LQKQAINQGLQAYICIIIAEAIRYYNHKYPTNEKQILCRHSFDRYDRFSKLLRHFPQVWLPKCSDKNTKS
jgi:hypothetical protein